MAALTEEGALAAPGVRTITAADEAAAVDTIVLAFATDPMARWSWPDAGKYMAAMPALTRAFGGGAFRNQGADCTDGFAGAALWLAPGVSPDDEALAEIVENTIPKSRHGEVNSVFEQMARFHLTEPHWYLPLIGVDPMYQGKGHGDALMTYALKRCDRDHLPAYLESTNPRNISLYKRHGFEVLGTIQVGSSPPLVPMLRRAR